MKIIVAPDSFKGSLSAQDFCRISKKVMQNHNPSWEVVAMPLADGGEGTLDCINTALSGIIEELEVTGPFFEEKTSAKIGFFEDGKTAVIESAMAMGLPLAGERKNPEITTTYGVGQMIDHAIQKKAQKIILALGGSSTNDCGAGMLSALGAKFYNCRGEIFVPVGGTLIDVDHVDFSELDKKIRNINFIAMCDVTNPLCGENGCSAIFGPQKGADLKMVQRLDKGCEHFAQVIQTALNKKNKSNYSVPFVLESDSNNNANYSVPFVSDFSSVPGAGAAGGLGFACVSALNGVLKSGIEIVLDLYHFTQNLADCDYIFTGEGKFDSQSLMGKTIGGIIKNLKQNNCSVPVIIFCGKNDTKGTEQNVFYKNDTKGTEQNVFGKNETKGTEQNASNAPSSFPVSIFEISRNVPLDYAMTHADQLLRKSIESWLETK